MGLDICIQILSCTQTISFWEKLVILLLLLTVYFYFLERCVEFLSSIFIRWTLNKLFPYFILSKIDVSCLPIAKRAVVFSLLQGKVT